METQINAAQMVEHIDRPAFCVAEGIIIAANKGALDRQVPLNASVEPLITDAQEEYAGFRGGILSLTIQVGESKWVASAEDMGTCHLFTLDSGDTGSELRALALAAQKLREPLAGVMASTDRLFSTLVPAETPSATEQMARINRGLHQMLRIINNMSDAARYSTDKPRMETRDVDGVLRELFEQAALLCGFSGIQVEYHGLSRPVYSMIDSEQIERCVYNILSNCLKSTPAGGSVRAELTRRGKKLYLTIQDTGCGAAETVFNQFLREPGIENSKHGIGLGLKLIQACANAHGGTVLVEPRTDQGLRLTISLPIRLDNTLHSPALRIDYAGEHSHGLMELSDSLPYELYMPKKKH